MAKGGQQETKVELPPEIKSAALQNLGIAKDAAAIPYAPNFGLQMAAFTPAQEAAFANTNQAAGAFGMPTAQGTGLPKPQNVGGFSGYATKPLYQNAVAQIPEKTKSMIEDFGRDRIQRSSFREENKSSRNDNINFGGKKWTYLPKASAENFQPGKAYRTKGGFTIRNIGGKVYRAN